VTPPSYSTRPLADIRVTGVTGFTHVTRRGKFIGRNAKRDVHGWDATEPVLRIHTDQGLDAIGFGRVGPEVARDLIGLSLADLWAPKVGAIGPLGRADHAVFDLVGKALGLPAWALMGGAGQAWVPVYDTSLYFSDLSPEHGDLGPAPLVAELEQGLKAGFRAFKVKVGRGARWMSAEGGLKREIEVVRALRRHGGGEVRLMADANDQYGFGTATRFLDSVGGDIDFLEEPFPESAAEGRRLKAWIAERGLTVQLADGESEHDAAVLEALVRDGALDIPQPDIRAHGLSGQWALSQALADRPEVRIASHNWGSYLGVFKMLQLGRGIGNFLIAEIDRTTSDLFDDSEWRLKDGRMFVPDEPGCGLRIREDVFARAYSPAAWRVGAAPS
jgi:D-galactarolactone cycloisomerase